MNSTDATHLNKLLQKSGYLPPKNENKNKNKNTELGNNNGDIFFKKGEVTYDSFTGRTLKHRGGSEPKPLNTLLRQVFAFIFFNS
jgi:hypothetical protein